VLRIQKMKNGKKGYTRYKQVEGALKRRDRQVEFRLQQGMQHHAGN
jgi:hypothetical protein